MDMVHGKARGTVDARGRPDDAAGASGRARGLLGACAGNLIEWFDFFVYAYTSIYFGASFFPSGDQASQLLATAGVFAVGFFMRPLGGWLFGRIADTRGRKPSMILAVVLMSAGSLLIAVLPPYSAVGVAAPALLLVARLMQGLSVGAEYGTGATYISEIATPGRRGFYGSFQYFTIVAGQLLALLTIVVLQHLLSPADLRAWGWRIPFAMGAVGAVVVMYLRRSMVESASSRDRHARGAGSVSGLLEHRRAVLLTLAFTAGGSLYFYTFTTYMQKFLVVSGGLTTEAASAVMTSALVCFMLSQPLFGMLSDRIGIRSNMLLFGGFATVSAVPLLLAIRSVSNPYAAFGLVLAGLLVGALYTPIAGLVKADLFPAPVRALGVGLPYAIANAAFGGTAEYVALSLRMAGVEVVYFAYVAALAALVFVASVALPDLRAHGCLDGSGDVEDRIGLRRRG